MIGSTNSTICRVHARPIGCAQLEHCPQDHEVRGPLFNHPLPDPQGKRGWGGGYTPSHSHAKLETMRTYKDATSSGCVVINRPHIRNQIPTAGSSTLPVCFVVAARAGAPQGLCTVYQEAPDHPHICQHVRKHLRHACRAPDYNKTCTKNTTRHALLQHAQLASGMRACQIEHLAPELCRCFTRLTYTVLSNSCRHKIPVLDIQLRGKGEPGQKERQAQQNLAT